MQEYLVGDKVYKPKGYKFVGEVIMAGKNSQGEWRYVVENGDGLLHIFNGSQLELQKV